MTRIFIINLLLAQVLGQVLTFANPSVLLQAHLGPKSTLGRGEQKDNAAAAKEVTGGSAKEASSLLTRRQFIREIGMIGVRIATIQETVQSFLSSPQIVESIAAMTEPADEAYGLLFQRLAWHPNQWTSEVNLILRGAFRSLERRSVSIETVARDLTNAQQYYQKLFAYVEEKKKLLSGLADPASASTTARQLIEKVVSDQRHGIRRLKEQIEELQDPSITLSMEQALPQEQRKLEQMQGILSQLSDEQCIVLCRRGATEDLQNLQTGISLVAPKLVQLGEVVEQKLHQEESNQRESVSNTETSHEPGYDTGRGFTERTEEWEPNIETSRKLDGDTPLQMEMSTTVGSLVPFPLATLARRLAIQASQGRVKLWLEVDEDGRIGLAAFEGPLGLSGLTESERQTMQALLPPIDQAVTYSLVIETGSDVEAILSHLETPWRYSRYPRIVGSETADIQTLLAQVSSLYSANAELMSWVVRIRGLLNSSGGLATAGQSPIVQGVAKSMVRALKEAGNRLPPGGIMVPYLRRLHVHLTWAIHIERGPIRPEGEEILVISAGGYLIVTDEQRQILEDAFRLLEQLGLAEPPHGPLPYTHVISFEERSKEVPESPVEGRVVNVWVLLRGYLEDPHRGINAYVHGNRAGYTWVSWPIRAGVLGILGSLRHEDDHHRFRATYQPQDLVTNLDFEFTEADKESLLTESRRPYRYLLELSGYLTRLSTQLTALERSLGHEPTDTSALLDTLISDQLLTAIETTLQILESEEGQAVLTDRGKALVNQFRKDLSTLRSRRNILAARFNVGLEGTTVIQQSI